MSFSVNEYNAMVRGGGAQLNGNSYYTAAQFLEALKKGLPIPPNTVVQTRTEGMDITHGGIDLSKVDFTKVKLPENVRIDGSLAIRDNPTFTALPRGWCIDHHLDISHCDNFRSLSENCKVLGDFFVTDCPSVTSLSDNLHLPGVAMVGRVPDPIDSDDYRYTGEIILENCPNLTTTPSCFLRLGALCDGSSRRVSIKNTAIPEHVIHSMRQLQGVRLA